MKKTLIITFQKGLILNMLTQLSYGLPAAPQFAISMTIFLTFSVYSLRISGDIPGWLKTCLLSYLIINLNHVNLFV